MPKSVYIYTPINTFRRLRVSITNVTSGGRMKLKLKPELTSVNYVIKQKAIGLDAMVRQHQEAEKLDEMKLEMFVWDEDDIIEHIKKYIPNMNITEENALFLRLRELVDRAFDELIVDENRDS